MKTFKTVYIKGRDWFINIDEVNTDMKELEEAIEICFKQDIDEYKKLKPEQKISRAVQLSHKYPHQTIPV